MPVVVANLPTPEGAKALSEAAAEAIRRHTTLIVVSGPEDVLDLDAAAQFDGADVKLEAGTGDVAADLVDAATRLDADLVVIGLRRRSPVGKLVLGAHAQRILLEAPCPVMAVKPTLTTPEH